MERLDVALFAVVGGAGASQKPENDRGRRFGSS